jgi:HEAT repeat protein
MRGLEDSAWRTKQGSVQLLGAMSACAPKQLGACLPQIVPKLSETLTDTHPKVVDAANAALKSIGDVIRNPEIRGLSKYLLGAISAPAERTAPCLDVLLEMTFVNTVDAPSLALIVPVLSRGLRDRSADLKKKAAKIAGNMCSLVADAKDMSPYVPILLPDIQKSLVDVSPEVRATAAAALASLLQGMGGAEAEQFSEVIPWLTRTLQSDGASTERSGAAQGLAECLAVLGPETFEAMLPEIFAGCAHVAPHVREGHLTLLRFLPLALGAAFEAHLKEALSSVLAGLADISEPVRHAALGAGRVFVEEFSHSGPSLDLLLPAIEEALGHENWRIRVSATELLGSMMFRIAGTSGKVRVEGGDDDEGISTEAQGALLTRALGEARHHDLLAAVYALRSDPVMAVRNAAVHI